VQQSTQGDDFRRDERQAMQVFVQGLAVAL
jgi:hypothetical protein